MAKQATELRYAVRFPVVFKYFGQLCLVLAVLTMVPLVCVADLSARRFYHPEICHGGLWACSPWGSGLARLRAPSNVQANEGMVVVALMFLFTPLVMCYPMMGSGLSFPGCSLRSRLRCDDHRAEHEGDARGAPATFLFARAWMQWYGGLGIVVLSLALVIQPGLVAKGLAVTEAESDDLVGGTRAHARRVLKVYGVLTVLGVIGSLLTGVGFFDAVLYTFAAVSTGGFAPHDGSLATGLLARTGVDYPALHRRCGPVDLLSSDVQGEADCCSGLSATAGHRYRWPGRSVAVGISMRLSVGMPWQQVLHHAPLLAFSAQTTSGFSSMPCDQLDAGSKLVLIFSMLVGGGVGSTAGGFKVLRLLIAASVFRVILLRTCLPKHAVLEPRLAGRRLQNDEVHASLLLILLFVMVVTLSWLLFVADGYNPLDSLFDVVSATGTVGLSVGVTSAALPGYLKGILCV